MRTDFAYVAMKLTEDDAHMFHMCFYETKPGETAPINNLTGPSMWTVVGAVKTRCC